jgi:hypothetical protein
MIIDVPVRNEDGTIRATLTMDEQQMQAILQFGLNFLLATGLAASYGVSMPGEKEDPQMPLKFND